MAMFKAEDGTEIEAFTAEEVKAQIEKETGGLKSKLDELLGETKTAKQKAKELEEAQSREAEERAKEKGEFKSLYEREQKNKSELADKYAALEVRIRTTEIRTAAAAIAGEMTRDAKRGELIVKEIEQFAKYEEGKIKFEIGGVEVDQSKVIAHINSNYPFLVDGSGASGGGAMGHQKGGGAAKGNMGGSKSERQAAIAARFNLPA